MSENLKKEIEKYINEFLFTRDLIFNLVERIYIYQDKQTILYLHLKMLHKKCISPFIVI